MKIPDNDEKRAILEGLIAVFRQPRRWVLFFGTGTSCALDKRFGMPALQEHLSATLADNPEWVKVDTALKSGRTLEQALTGIGLSRAAKATFRHVTGDYIARIDRTFRDELLLHRRDGTTWVGTRLLKLLVKRLPPPNPRLSLITSNYDMLIEYACSAHAIPWTTGFVGGLTRVWNWEVAQNGLQVTGPGRRGAVHTTPLPRVELFKVHGSINRFTVDSQQVECDLWTDAVPAGLERDVAVPGDLKYEQFAVSNMDTVSHAMRVEDEAPAFAVMGYGFNDPHLHQRILARVQTQDCPLVVMTLDLDEAKIAELRKCGSHVWFLVAPRLPGGGNDASRTAVYMPGQVDPYVLDGERLWSCDSFAERILGG